MDIHFEDRKVNFVPVGRTVKWRASKSQGEIELNFDTVVDAVYSHPSNCIVVLNEGLVEVYDVYGKRINFLDVSKIKGYQIRGLNSNYKSNSGVTLIALPIDEKNKTKWGDMIQFEFNLEENQIGAVIGIYR